MEKSASEFTGYLFRLVVFIFYLLCLYLFYWQGELKLAFSFPYIQISVQLYLVP